MRRSRLALLVSTVLVSASALLSAACGLQAEGIGVDGSFDRTITLAGPADVNVTGRSGGIHVTAGASNQVRIAARIQAFGSFEYTALQQVEQLEGAPPIQVNGGSISIGEIGDSGLGRNVSISYDITVPPQTRIRTSSRSGSQTFTAIKGSIDALSRSGNIRVTDGAGPLRLESRSGEVVVEGEPSGQWDIETRSGGVKLRLPTTAGFDVDVESRSGSIHTSQAIESAGVLRRKGFKGRIHGGGHPVAISTYSGSIRID